MLMKIVTKIDLTISIILVILAVTLMLTCSIFSYFTLKDIKSMVAKVIQNECTTQEANKKESKTVNM